MKYTVDRKTWFRGKGAGSSKLLRSDGMRCCIGHCLKQQGVSDQLLLNRSCIRPDGSEQVIPWVFGPEDAESFTDIYDAYEANDDQWIDDATRESRLTELFAQHDHELEFIN